LKSTFSLAAHVVGEPLGHQRNQKSSKLNETEEQRRRNGAGQGRTGGGKVLVATQSLLQTTTAPLVATLAPSIIDSMGPRFNLAYMSLISTFINPSQSPRMIHVVSVPLAPPNYAKVCPFHLVLFIAWALLPWVNFNYAHLEPFNANEKQNVRSAKKQ